MNTDNSIHEYYIRLKESESRMNTHEARVSLETAKMLQKAGFDWECEYAYYEPFAGIIRKTDIKWDGYVYDAPTIDVVQRWLREVQGLHMCVKADAASINCKYFVTVIISDTKWGNVQDENKKTILFSTYEEAQEAGIKKALEIILEKGE